MRQPAYFEECNESSSFIVGVFIGTFLTGIVLFILLKANEPSPEITCRDGKLFEVSHEGNITIYDPTYNECEEIK